MPDTLSGLLGLGGLAASAYLPYEESGAQIDYLKNQIPTYLSQAEDITNRAVSEAQFTPFTVKTGTGTTSVGAGGGVTQTLGATPQAIETGLLGAAKTATGQLGTAPDVSALQSSAFGGAGTALQGATAQDQGLLASRAATQNLLSGQLGDIGQPASQLSGLTSSALQGAQTGLAQAAPTAQSIYDQIRGMQSPEEERQRLALENRLAAQGRLGVQTAAYGGTPEQLAMAKAQEEARNSAAYQAINQADQLATSQQARAAQLGQLGMAGTQAQQGLTSQQLQDVLGLQQSDIMNAQAQQALQTGALGQASGLFGLGTQAAALPASLDATQLQNIQNMLTAGYAPQQQSLAALGAASPFSQLATSAALSRAEQLSSGGQYGLEALVGGNANIANLEGMRAQALANTLSGMFTASSATATSPLEIVLKELGIG